MSSFSKTLQLAPHSVQLTARGSGENAAPRRAHFVSLRLGDDGAAPASPLARLPAR